MHLVRMIYASKVTEGFSAQDIETILESARKHNGKAAITGILCFNNNFFLQCLEGNRSAVNATYQRILKDNRHTHIELLEYEEIDERQFSDWSMGYVPESSLTKPINIKYSGTPYFDPYEMSGQSSHMFLNALRGEIATA